MTWLEWANALHGTIRPYLFCQSIETCWSGPMLCTAICGLFNVNESIFAHNPRVIRTIAYISTTKIDMGIIQSQQGVSNWIEEKMVYLSLFICIWFEDNLVSVSHLASMSASSPDGITWVGIFWEYMWINREVRKKFTKICDHVTKALQCCILFVCRPVLSVICTYWVLFYSLFKCLCFSMFGFGS